MIKPFFLVPKALDPYRDSFYIPPDRRGLPAPLFIGGKGTSWLKRAISSAVEHFVDIEGVTSSILVSPTIFTVSHPAKHPQPQALARAAKKRRDR